MNTRLEELLKARIMLTSHTKNLKNEKGRDREKVNKQDGMPM